MHAARGLLRCPHCGADLDPDGTRWVCPAGHAFDVAKQGYLNLSGAAEPANADTPAMLDARARVQTAGTFDFLSRALYDEVPSTGEVRTLLDVGAGTGHYLAGLVEANPPARGIALDVGRAAARRAAKAHPRVASVVADVWRPLPVPSGTIDVVLCVFAPRNPAEFARVLTPHGRVIVVTPAADHLVEARERYGLLGIEADKTERLLGTMAEFLSHERTVSLRRTGTLAADVVDDLIGMGPNAFHEPPRPGQAQQVTLALDLHVFRPLPPGG
jgi:23S rRNA (guanine745-N1)-methyltransferase